MDALLRNLLVAQNAYFGQDGAVRGALHFGDPAAEYAALTGAVGIADFSERTQIELTGADRQTFLHNLCTNEIRRLPPGSGCEAFLCNAQGHVLALVYVFCGPESLVVETVAEQEPPLLAHLDRYLIREKVEIHPRSEDWSEVLVSGPASSELLGKLAGQPPAELFQHHAASLAGINVSVRRVDFTGSTGFLISASRADIAQVWQALIAGGAIPCGAQAVEVARVEAGTPYYERDITAANLPQEVARDKRAISFTKGCYIGQETVARLDALGHVNRTLVGLRFTGTDLPAPQTELASAAGKTVGQVTSAVFSPRLAAPLALAYVRRETNQPGAPLQSAVGPAEVIPLPL